MPTDVEADFAQQLRAAAESAVQPAPASLYAGAVGRGRRIRRVSMVRRLLAWAATLGAVAAVGVPLLVGASTGATGAAAPYPTGAGAVSTVTAATPPGTGWMPAYVVRTLQSLLPAGSRTEKAADLGGISLQVSAPEVQAPGGQSLAVVSTDVETPTGRSTITLSVANHIRNYLCPGKAVAPHDVCTRTALAGGTFYLDESFKDYAHGTGAAIWTLAWTGPEGQTVYLGMSTHAPAQALTVPQAQALLTAPAWERVWKALPAPCRFGVTARPHLTEAQVLEQRNMFVCATSRAAAQHSPG